MANKEVIEVEIKAQIGSAKKQLEQVNNLLEEQKDILVDLQKEELALKTKRLGMSEYERSLSGVDKRLEHLKDSIGDQKIAIKNLTDEQKKANKELKDTNKEAKDSIGNFKIMGVSLNGLKSSFKKIIPSIKLMFGTIKAGIMSTGIGLLLVAFGSLVSYFTSTKRGADKLKLTFTRIGATIDVLKDRLSNLGEAISLVFSGEWKKAGEALKKTFSGVGDEIRKEVAAMVALEKRIQALRDAEIEFSIQKAKTRQEIEKARLVAEDETKSAAERLKNLKKALELEEKTTNRELELAREKVAIQEEQMALSENLVEDEEKLAQLKVDLIEKETASIKMRRRVVTEVNSLEREIAAEEKRRADEKLKQIEDEKKALEDLYKAQIKQADDWEKKVLAQLEALTIARLTYASKVGQSIGQLGNLMEEGSNAAKALALTEIAINTAVGFMQGLNIAQKAAAATGPAAAYAFPIFYASQVASVLGALKSAQGVLGGETGTTSVVPSVTNSTPAPEMLSGKFELGGTPEQQPIQAYVVTDELTDNQNKLAYIRRRATI